MNLWELLQLQDQPMASKTGGFLMIIVVVCVEFVYLL